MFEQAPKIGEGRALLCAALDPYIGRFEEYMTRTLEAAGEPARLREACQYAMGGKAKRLRPAMAYMVADALGHGFEVSPAALAIECLHSSALVADDLPCVDNDDWRRGQPSCHKKFDEATALFASYTLVAIAFEQIADNAKIMSQAPGVSDEQSALACRLALMNAAKNTGFEGVNGGQYEDLFPSRRSEEAVRRILRRKTGRYFESAMAMGWLFGGGDAQLLPVFSELAYYFGILFQIVDDLEDFEKDRAIDSGSNYIVVCGKERSQQVVEECGRVIRENMRKTHISSEPFEQVVVGLEMMAAEGFSSLASPGVKYATG